MLVLSRKLGERILLRPQTALAGDIVITVVRIGPNAVRLGIQAPNEIDIVREEISHAPVPGVCVPAPLAFAFKPEAAR